MSHSAFRSALLPRLLCVAALLAGCDSVRTLEVSVNVVTEVQDMFSAAQPGQVLFYDEEPDFTYAVAVLCDPTAELVTFELVFERTECSTPGFVEAWIERIDLPPGADPECDERRHSLITLEERSDGSPPYDSVTVFPDADPEPGNFCSPGTAVVELWLTPNL